MVTLMRKIESIGVEPNLYPWGKAVLTDKWVILHKDGNPKLAISYREKVTAIKVTDQLLGLKKNN
jgi:hypothetical protein